MRVVVIGGSGHIGTYLVPRLVEAGYDVISISRGQSKAYQPHTAWNQVEKIILDRTQEDKEGIFGKKIAALKPDIVIDLICFKPDSAKMIVEALRGQVRHFLSAGTIWVHGHAIQTPASEEEGRHPICQYGIFKDQIEKYLLYEARHNGFPATILHPGHITGPGYVCINPAGNKDPDIFEKLIRGEEVFLPNIGMETLHHVHADDVAQGFMKSIENWSTSIGQNFHIVAPSAITMRGFAEEVASWFGKEANLTFLPFEEWRKTASKPDSAAKTWNHIAHSDNYSIEKAKRLINYQPRYTILQATYECVTWLVTNGVIKV